MMEERYYKLGVRSDGSRPLKINRLLYIDKCSIFRGTDI
jgi:hypothetical protein